MKLLRESMLMSVITNNLEVSFNLTAKDMKTLNDLDMQLLQRCLHLGARSSQCLMLLELGLTSVAFLVKKKRIMYLFHIITTDTSSLVSQVFWKQVKSSTVGNWVGTVINDLKELNINLSFSQIAQMTKPKFKILVRQSCENASFSALVKEKETLSKGKFIKYDSLKTQPYLLSESGLNVDMMRKIYQVKCR